MFLHENAPDVLHKKTPTTIKVTKCKLDSKVLIVYIVDVPFSIMCYNLAGSVESQELWLWDTARTRNFFCFLLFWESFNSYNFGTTGPIQVRFSAKCTSPNEDFNQINKLFDIPTDSPISHHIFSFTFLLLLSCCILKLNMLSYYILLNKSQLTMD